MVIAAFHFAPQSLSRWVTAGLLVTAAGPAWAADASDWAHSKHSAARLLAGGGSAEQRQFHRAGIEVKLAPGWKTYWRHPGDSGTPPRFDFSASQNLERAEVLWPAPFRFPDGAGFSVGYKNEVVFPLRVWPRDSTQLVQLNLSFDYAVCEKICIPAEAKLALALPPATSAHEATLKAGEDRIPRRAGIGDGAALAIKSITITRTKPPKMTIILVAPREGKVDLFAEAPRGDWSAPLPEVVDRNAETRTFNCALDDLPERAYAPGAPWTFTAISGSSAIEVSAHLD